MAKAFVYEVRFLLGTENEYLLERVASSGDRQRLPYEPNDINWMALLCHQKSFRFLGRQGSLSVCLERSWSKDPTSRGEKVSWSAYRKAHGVQVKTYLGQDLTTNKLEATAAHVLVRLREKLGLPDDDPLLTTRSARGKSKEQQHITHLLDQLESKDQMMADLQQELAQRDQIVTDLKQELAKRDQVIAKLREHPSSQGKRRKPHGKRP